MLGEGGESRFDTNINFLLEEYGIMVNNGDYYLTTFYLFVCATVYIWGSEDNVGELVLSFLHGISRFKLMLLGLVASAFTH